MHVETTTALVVATQPPPNPHHERLERLRDLTRDIQACDVAAREAYEEGARRRWLAGQELVAMRGGMHRLPNGLLKRLSKELDRSSAELCDWMKLATVCRSEEELSDVVRHFSSWRELRTRGLREPAAKKGEKPHPLSTVVERLRKLDPKTISEEERELLKEGKEWFTDRLSTERHPLDDALASLEYVHASQMPLERMHLLWLNGIVSMAEQLMDRIEDDPFRSDQGQVLGQDEIM